jgi:hypothetical protein
MDFADEKRAKETGEKRIAAGEGNCFSLFGGWILIGYICHSYHLTFQQG